ncbi:hypothetical protein MAR_010290 [Mya arenaria]|uniref:G-protein coupled receptors family 2 profile 2 domain-containing protein n=1 Tax=Mya arenaria TaxID=6604 RepID=A0ABY7E4K2_MYAAR|nr:hypothetical protein MAR_010290 [Mya arenaria]
MEKKGAMDSSEKKLAVIKVWVQYFFTCAVFWHVVYGVETFLTSKGKKSTTVCINVQSCPTSSTSFMKHFLGWAVPAALCSIIAFLGYRPSNSSCGASEQSVRAVMYVMFLCPVVLAIITMVSFFCRASREGEYSLTARRSLIRRYGRFTPLERATVENLQVKFAIISLAFCVGWVPNVLNGIFINVLDERSSDVILVFLVLEVQKLPCFP